MKPLGESNSHFWLAQRMAKATDTDLVAAMEKAELSQEDWAEMVLECRGCDWTKGCKRWLGLHARTPVREAPDACVNQHRFMALKSALEELEQ